MPIIYIMCGPWTTWERTSRAQSRLTCTCRWCSHPCGGRRACKIRENNRRRRKGWWSSCRRGYCKCSHCCIGRFSSSPWWCCGHCGERARPHGDAPTRAPRGLPWDQHKSLGCMGPWSRTVLLRGMTCFLTLLLLLGTVCWRERRREVTNWLEGTWWSDEGGYIWLEGDYSEGVSLLWIYVLLCLFLSRESFLLGPLAPWCS